VARPRYLALVALALVGCKGKAQTPPLEKLYALDEIGEIRVELSEEAQASLRDKPREWVEASGTILGKPITKMGVRIKGHRSLRPFDSKPSLKLDFDRFLDGAKVHGVGEMVLNNMVEDPTMLREFLGYRLYRAAKVPAPRVGYVNLYIAGEHRGLYAVIEAPNEDFIRAHFPGELGVLYEGEYGCDLYPPDVAGFDRDLGKKGRKELRELTATAEKGTDALFYDKGHPIDTEEFLAYLAVSAFIADFDGYRHAHNYRIYYHPKTGAWSFLPWGIDRSFKKDLGLFDSYGVAAKLCFSHARCRSDYLRTLKRVIAEFSKLDFEAGIDVVGTITAKHLSADPKRPHNAREVRKARKALRKFVRSRAKDLEPEFACLSPDGKEIDADGDGYGCLDCNDGDKSVHPGVPDTCGDGIDNNCSGQVDDGPTCECKEQQIGEATFHMCTTLLPWHEAASHCRAKGLHLAKVDDPEQSRALFDAVRKLDDGRWWIGLSDHKEEGRWMWDDGSSLEKPAWRRGEPDNDACNQDCAALREDSKGRWHDTHCGQPRPFVCR